MQQQLARLQDQAQFDSSGRFTLDPRRARELLRDFQLPEPHHCVLHLVSFLIGLGAREVRVETGPPFSLLGLGVCLDPDVVANPLSPLFCSAMGTALRELAIGVNAALARPEPVVLQSFSGDKLAKGCYCQERFEFSEETSSQEPQIHLSLTLASPTRAREAIDEAFAYAPVPLFLDRRLCSGRLNWPPKALTLQLVPSSVHPGTALFLPVEPHCPWSHPGPLQALVSIFPGQDSGVHWLVLGRDYPMPLSWRFPSGELAVQIWVACDCLDKDLSQSRLVTNTRYERLGEFLRDTIFQAVDALVEGFLDPSLPLPAPMDCLGPLLRAVVEACAQKGDLDLAYRVQARLAQLGAGELEEYRRALIEQALGRPGLVSVVPPDSLPLLWEMTRASLAILGPHHAVTREHLNRCAQKAYEKESFELALRCLRVYCQGASAPANARLCWGQCCLRLSLWEEARQVLGQLQRDGHELGDEWVEGLALAESSLGRLKEAARLLAQVLRRKQLRHGDRSQNLGLTLEKLVVLCRQMGDTQTARHYARWVQTLDR